LHTYSITNDITNDLGLIPVPQALSACIYIFSWEEKLIAPLIATPNRVVLEAAQRKSLRFMNGASLYLRK
jgi:hypothetical protein